MNKTTELTPSLIYSEKDSQRFLDIIAKLDGDDGFNFLEESEDGYGTHRPVLWLALWLTQHSRLPIIEMGSGEGSTPYLREFCLRTGRDLLSIESDPDWAEKMGSKYTENWDACEWWQKPCSILFIDHAPGEHRVKALVESKDRAEIIVVHDTELYSAGNYGFDSKKGPESIWNEFRYVLHYNRKGGGAGATACSQTINLNQFKFLSLGNFTFE